MARFLFSARSKARKRAVDLIYAAELRKVPVADLLEESSVEKPLNPYTVTLVEGWSEHSEEIDRDYAGQRARFTGLAEQVRARHILIKYEETDSDEVKAAADAVTDDVTLDGAARELERWFPGG